MIHWGHSGWENLPFGHFPGGNVRSAPVKGEELDCHLLPCSSRSQTSGCHSYSSSQLPPPALMLERGSGCEQRHSENMALGSHCSSAHTHTPHAHATGSFLSLCLSCIQSKQCPGLREAGRAGCRYSWKPLQAKTNAAFLAETLIFRVKAAECTHHSQGTGTVLGEELPCLSWSFVPFESLKIFKSQPLGSHVLDNTLWKDTLVVCNGKPARRDIPGPVCHYWGKERLEEKMKNGKDASPDFCTLYTPLLISFSLTESSPNYSCSPVPTNEQLHLVCTENAKFS